MKTTTVGFYAFRFAFGQQASQAISQSTTSSLYVATAPDRVVTRFATCLAVFGFALSSFSLKQMLSSNKTNINTIPMRKF